MYVIYQTEISGLQATSATTLAIVVLSAWVPAEIGAHLAVLGVTASIPGEPVDIDQQVIKKDNAGNEVLTYKAGVAALEVVDEGDTDDDLVSSAVALIDGVWTLTRVFAPHQTRYRTSLTPLEFKMAFTSVERLALRQAREYAGDDVAIKTTAMLIDDWWSIVDDPRLTVVDLALPQTQDGLDMLVAAEILTPARREAIGLGLPE